VVATSALRQAVQLGRRLTLLNRHAVSARRGLILSGAAGTGKTTALTQFGKTHEAIDRARHPGWAGQRIPVIYVTVPPAATPRMLAAEFARFLGLPIIASANITDIIESVCGVAVDTRVSLVCDEIHNLRLTTRTGAEVSDTLKYFSERIPATFVYAGIDVEREGLFAGTRGRQIAGRFCLIETVPFPYGEEWKGLVATFEAALRLHRQRGSDQILIGQRRVGPRRRYQPCQAPPASGWAGMSNPVGDHPRPLPIRPRPVAGDSIVDTPTSAAWPAPTTCAPTTCVATYADHQEPTRQSICNAWPPWPAAPYRRSNMSSPTSIVPTTSHTVTSPRSQITRPPAAEREPTCSPASAATPAATHCPSGRWPIDTECTAAPQLKPWPHQCPNHASHYRRERPAWIRSKTPSRPCSGPTRTTRTSATTASSRSSTGS
jgi:hypothetical protein